MQPEQLQIMAAIIISGRTDIPAKDAVKKAREIVAEVALEVNSESGELRLREDATAGKAGAKE